MGFHAVIQTILLEVYKYCVSLGNDKRRCRKLDLTRVSERFRGGITDDSATSQEWALELGR